MKELNFPVIKGRLPLGKTLSMDDYLKFVMLNLKYIFNTKNRKQNKPIKKGTPFKI
jgi:hypothetical protein